MGIPVDFASCLSLTNNEIRLGSAVPLARRSARDGRWELDRLDRRSMAALLAYACDMRGLSPASCAEAIHEAAGLIGRDDEEVRARLRALPLRTAVSKDDILRAHRLAQLGVPGPRLAAEVRRAKLGLDKAPPFSAHLTLCDQGVVLGCGTVIAPLVDSSGRRLGLQIAGREAELLALLSVARGAPAPTQILDRFESVSRALQREDRALAETGLALVGQPALPGRDAAETLAKAAAALRAGVDPRVLMKALEGAAPVDKASPEDPKHPGWPKGDPEGRGGQFRPKTADDDPARPSNGKPRSGGPMSAASSLAVKIAIRAILARAEYAPDPRIVIAALLVEVALDAYPYVSAYFDPPKSLEELQAAAQSPSEEGYDDHHIVEQATANPDGGEAARINAPDNLARIPTVKHWELNRWYQTPNREFNGLSPRQYLQGKSWEERRRVGLMGLRRTGVLQ